MLRCSHKPWQLSTTMLNRVFALLSGRTTRPSKRADTPATRASQDSQKPRGHSTHAQRDASTSTRPDQPIVTDFELGDFSIDEYRPFKVIVVGAGFSGIAAGIRYVTTQQA